VAVNKVCGDPAPQTPRAPTRAVWEPPPQGEMKNNVNYRPKASHVETTCLWRALRHDGKRWPRQAKGSQLGVHPTRQKLEIVQVGGLGGPGGPEYPLERWGVKPPTLVKGLSGPGGRRAPQTDRLPILKNSRTSDPAKVPARIAVLCSCREVGSRPGGIDRGGIGPTGGIVTG
jgi:hypothetical protein